MKEILENYCVLSGKPTVDNMRNIKMISIELKISPGNVGNVHPTENQTRLLKNTRKGYLSKIMIY